MKPDYTKTWFDERGTRHALEFYCDPQGRRHVVVVRRDGPAGEWTPARVAQLVETHARVQPFDQVVFEKEGDQVWRNDFKQSHLTATGPDGRPNQGPDKTRSSEEALSRELGALAQERQAGADRRPESNAFPEAGRKFREEVKQKGPKR